MSLITRKVSNPEGLNDIIFDLSGEKTDNVWDANLHMNQHMGKLTDKQAKGKVSQIWGKSLEQQAFQYLKSKLKSFGWNLKNGQMINDEEYDCIGWLGKKRGLQDLDLAIEIYFPKPQNDNETYELPFAVEKTRRMREKLRKLNAKRKYILIGVPPNKVITTTEIVHLDMKTVYQRHKFGKMRMVKQTKLKV